MILYIKKLQVGGRIINKPQKGTASLTAFTNSLLTKKEPSKVLNPQEKVADPQINPDATYMYSDNKQLPIFGYSFTADAPTADFNKVAGVGGGLTNKFGNLEGQAIQLYGPGEYDYKTGNLPPERVGVYRGGVKSPTYKGFTVGGGGQVVTGYSPYYKFIAPSANTSLNYQYNNPKYSIQAGLQGSHANVNKQNGPGKEWVHNLFGNASVARNLPKGQTVTANVGYDPFSKINATLRYQKRF